MPQKETLRASSQPSTTTAGTKNGPWTWAMIKVAACFLIPYLLLYALSNFLTICLIFFFLYYLALLRSRMALRLLTGGCSEWEVKAVSCLLGQYALCMTAHTHTHTLVACTPVHSVQPLHLTRSTTAVWCTDALWDWGRIHFRMCCKFVWRSIQGCYILICDSCQTLVEHVHNLNLRGIDFIISLKITKTPGDWRQ